MNAKYHLVWRAGAAVPEVAKRRAANGAMRAIRQLIGLAVGTGLGFAALAAPPVNEVPTGGQIVAGSASISQNAATLTVQQASQRAVIDWNSFNVGSQGQVNFNQPNPAAATLNRVLDSRPSEIFGRINANGQVYLVNPSGVYFGPSASVDVGSLVATTLAMSTADFMAGRNVFQRNGSTGTVFNAGRLSATPDGELGGYLALLAPEVRNEGVIVAELGTVAMASGESVTLSISGSRHLSSIVVAPSQIKALVENRHLVQAPGGLVLLSAQAANTLQGGVVNNAGQLEANGMSLRAGRIVLESSDRIDVSGRLEAKAAGSGGNIDITSDGDIRLTDAQMDVSGENRGGRIWIAGGQLPLSDAVGKAAMSGGVPEPLVLVSGNTHLQANGVAGQGGEVTVTGHHVAVIDDTRIEASGATGGGVAQIGGSWQNSNPDVPQATSVYFGRDASVDVSATKVGAGGTAAMWSDISNPVSATRAYGSILAKGGAQGGDGGRIETSGHWLDVLGASIDASAPRGIGGLWLLDPYDLTVTGAATNTTTFGPGGPGFLFISDAIGTNVLNTDIESQLNGGTSVLLQTGAGSLGFGDILVNANIAQTAGGISMLFLDAHRNVEIAPGVSISDGGAGSLGVSVMAGSGGTGNIALNGNIAVTGPVDLTTSTGDITIGATGTLSAPLAILNAGAASVPGTAAGGNIITAGTVTSPAAIYFSGSVAASTGLTALVGSGSGNFLYNTDETTFAAPPGVYAVYREQPVLVVTPSSASIPYGSAIPGFTGTLSGFVNGDTSALVAGTASFSVGPVLGVGSYNVAYTGGLTNGLGYAITDNAGSSGELSVSAAPLSITATNLSKPYGQAYNFLGTEFTSSGLQNGEAIGSVLLSSPGAPAAAGVSATPYPISISGATGGSFNPANYAISYVNGAMTVNPALLTVTALDNSKTYGQTVSFDGNEFFVSGLQNFETVTSVSLASDGSAPTANVPLTPYPIVPSAATGSFSPGNYSVSYVNGSLTVLPAPLTITAADAVKTFGNLLSFQGTEFSSLGLQNGELIAAVDLASAGAAANAPVSSSLYAITPSGARGTGFNPGNYAIDYIDGSLIVVPPPPPPPATSGQTGNTPSVRSVAAPRTVDEVRQMSPAQIRLLSPIQIAGLDTAILQALEPEQLAALSHQQVNALSSEQVQQFTLAQFQAIVPADLATLDDEIIAALIPSAKRALLKLAAVARKYANDPNMNYQQAIDFSKALVSFIRQLLRSEDFMAGAAALPWHPALAEMRYGAWPVFPGMQFKFRPTAQTEEKESSPLTRLAADIGGFFAQKKAEGLFSVASAKLAIKRSLQGRAVRTLFESTPIVGNLLSLYTVATGKDPLTDELVGDAERALAVLGTIPGGGALLRVAGSSSITVVRRLLSSSAGERLEQIKDVGETALELVEIFKQFSENVNADNSPEIVAVANTLFASLLKSADLNLKCDLCKDEQIKT